MLGPKGSESVIGVAALHPYTSVNRPWLKKQLFSPSNLRCFFIHLVPIVFDAVPGYYQVKQHIKTSGLSRSLEEEEEELENASANDALHACK